MYSETWHRCDSAVDFLVEQRVFIVLLLTIRVSRFRRMSTVSRVWFAVRVSVRIVRFRFSDRVGIGFLDVE